MEQVVKLKDGSTRIGIPISTGPESYRLMLTWPYHDGGHVVEIDRSEIEAVSETEPREIGKKPRL